MAWANRPIPWGYVILSIAAIAGGAMGIYFIVSGGLFLGALCFFLAGATIVSWGASQDFHLRRQIPVAADDVYYHAQRWFGRAPWVLSRDDGRELVFWRHTEPVLGVLLILLALGVVPGILYYFWARGTQTVHIAARPISGGTDFEIMVQPRLGDGRARVVDFFNSLHGLT